MRGGLGFFFFFGLVRFLVSVQEKEEAKRERERERRIWSSVVSSGGGSLYFPRNSAFYVFAAVVTATSFTGI